MKILVVVKIIDMNNWKLSLNILKWMKKKVKRLVIRKRSLLGGLKNLIINNRINRLSHKVNRIVLRKYYKKDLR